LGARDGGISIILQRCLMLAAGLAIPHLTGSLWLSKGLKIWMDSGRNAASIWVLPHATRSNMVHHDL